MLFAVNKAFSRIILMPGNKTSLTVTQAPATAKSLRTELNRKKTLAGTAALQVVS
ncbi:MAG: hypothetical protein ACU83U_15975 [Gammaproteobacteria bacterium]